jgi:oligopeptidase B
MPAPSAKQIPLERTLHGDVFVDEFAWLRNREDPDTVTYLEAENAYALEATTHLSGLRDAIFSEIKSRVQETDLSAPARRGPYWYAVSTEEGRQYPTFVRMKGAPDGPTEILLDVNELAEGHDYCQLGVFAVSPDHRLAAYSVNTDGSEEYTMRIKDLEAGSDTEDVLERTYYSAAWSADASYLFYTTIDEAHRPDKVWRHRLGAPQSDDQVVVDERDERMYLSVGSSQDEHYLLVVAGSQTTSDARYLDATDPTGEWEFVAPRVHGVEYSMDHRNGRWLIVTNQDAVNGKLVSVAVTDPDDTVELVAHDPLEKVAGVLALRGHTVVAGRRHGLSSLTVIPDQGAPHDIRFDEPVYTVGLGRNLEFDTDTLRISYQSLRLPPRVIDVNLATGAQTLVKETPVLGGFDPEDYLTLRQWAQAPDGTMIPISIVHRADLDRGGPVPVLLYGYGSYEATMDPWFSVARLSLLDRGAVFALAHPRGGGEMGKLWYEDGKMAKKTNTFTDFIACAEHLIGSGWTAPDRLVIRGGSAGGLLMGAVTTMRPDLFKAVVAEVPFVDVINTMLDESLPLTVIEWEEWGNPQIEDQYRSMAAYSPYENTGQAEYPAMLVTAGLNDPRVSYWEPAKWVARMRAHSKNRGPLLLKTEMGAGHRGPSGRYDAWHDEAFILAFVLDQMGLADG